MQQSRIHNKHLLGCTRHRSISSWRSTSSGRIPRFRFRCSAHPCSSWCRFRRIPPSTTAYPGGTHLFRPGVGWDRSRCRNGACLHKNYDPDVTMVCVYTKIMIQMSQWCVSAQKIMIQMSLWCVSIQKLWSRCHYGVCLHKNYDPGVTMVCVYTKITILYYMEIKCTRLTDA